MLTIRRIGFAVCLIVALNVAASFGWRADQVSGATDVVLTVGGEVERPLKLSLADLAKLPRLTVRGKDHDGKEHKYDGVALGEVLRQAGVKFGKELRGKALATYLLVEASDGYKAVFALPELDPGYTDRVIVLADRRDDAPLEAREGPLQIIVPDEKLHARWVRQVKSLIIRRS
jgi:DMSO/TMAO reductase YedYZ molybdopterin-dependent catalytic subunit